MSSSDPSDDEDLAALREITQSAGDVLPDISEDVSRRGEARQDDGSSDIDYISLSEDSGDLSDSSDNGDEWDATLPALPESFVPDATSQTEDWSNVSPDATVMRVNALLAANKEIQELCQRQLNSIKMALTANQNLRRRLRPMLHPDKASRAKSAPAPSFFSKPGQVQELDTTVSIFSHQGAGTTKAASSGDYGVLVTHQYRKWTPEETNDLRLAVAEFQRNAQVHPLKQEWKGLMDERARVGLDAAKDVRQKALLQRITDLRNMSLDELLLLDYKEVNWAKVRKSKITGEIVMEYLVAQPSLRERTDDECRIMWTNTLYPGVNDAKWDVHEDKSLLDAVVKYEKEGHKPDWEEIAKRLGTNRTAGACLIRYQRSLNPKLLKKHWTKQEDDILRRLVNEYGAGKWAQIASHMPGRTNQQVMHRWDKALNPAIKKGKWSAEEDQALIEGVKLFGSGNWKKVATVVPARNDQQCRERYVNVLDPELMRERDWPPEVESAMDEAVAECITDDGIMWSRVAAIMATKGFKITDNQCWRRWQTRHPEEAKKYRAAVVTAKMVMRRNFMGREAEKPGLNVADVNDNLDDLLGLAPDLVKPPKIEHAEGGRGISTPTQGRTNRKSKGKSTSIPSVMAISHPPAGHSDDVLVPSLRHMMGLEEGASPASIRNFPPSERTLHSLAMVLATLNDKVPANQQAIGASGQPYQPITPPHPSTQPQQPLAVSPGNDNIPIPTATANDRPSLCSPTRQLGKDSTADQDQGHIAGGQPHVDNDSSHHAHHHHTHMPQQPISSRDMLALRLGSLFMWPALMSLATVNRDRALVEAALGPLPPPIPDVEEPSAKPQQEKRKAVARQPRTDRTKKRKEGSSSTVADARADEIGDQQENETQ